MFTFENDANLVQDREDLVAVLRMRFGSVPTDIMEAIYQINELSTLERLILVAANAPTFDVFLEEIGEDESSFRIVGDRFNPIASLTERGAKDGEKRK